VTTCESLRALSYPGHTGRQVTYTTKSNIRVHERCRRNGYSANPSRFIYYL